MDSRSKALLKGAAILLSLFFGFINLSARVYEVKSPSGKLTLSVSAGTTCTWSLSVGEKQIIKDSRLGLDAGSVVLGDNLAFTPVYVDIGDAGRLLLMEADLWDYPGMFLKTAAQGFEAEFPPCPSGYLADVDGERTYPWRVVAYAEHETGLPVNNMVYQLAAPCRIEDTSWIKPGQSSWDWWAGFTLHGVNAGKVASDYSVGEGTVTAADKMDIHMAPGGGFVVMLEKKEK